MESTPIEKREIRGLTLDSLLKYGSLVVMLVTGSYLIKADTERNKARIDQLEIDGAKREKRIEALELKNAATEIWKARIEEQIKKP